MPEGPSIVILKEEVDSFKGKKIIQVEGNSKLNIKRLEGRKITDFKSWGKHFLICFEGFTVRIHFLLFGSYRINERRENISPRLSLQFKKGEINFYTCSVKFIEEDLDMVYDWTVDTMSDKWKPGKAMKALTQNPEAIACDVLLDQNIFAGSGNIIKNEVLFRIKLHPESVMGGVPLAKKKELVKETRNYCFDFYRWKKKYELRKHWQVYRKKICPRCNIRLAFGHLGKNKRRSFYCINCQILYQPANAGIKSTHRRGRLSPNKTIPSSMLK